MQGERMEMPEMDSEGASLIPPAPYSIPALGFDIAPEPSSVAKKSRPFGKFTLAAFGVIGGLAVGSGGILAEHRLHPQSAPLFGSVRSVGSVAAASPAATPLPNAASGPVPVADPLADKALAEKKGAPAEAAGDTASATGDISKSPLPKKKPTHHRPAPRPHAPAASAALSSAPTSDDAFMRAIGAASK